MKNLIVAAFVGLVTLSLSAQKIIEKNINYSGQFIDLEVKFASDIEVKTWDKSTVYFKADITTKDGKFIDLYDLDIDESSSSITIAEDAIPVFKAFQNEWDKNHPGSKNRGFMEDDSYEFNYVLYVPKNARFKVSSINGDLKAEVIQGNFTAELINGNIDIKTYDGDMDLQTINGEIDLVMKNSRLVAETIHGNIYADEKLNLKVTDRYVGQKVEGSFDKATHRLKLNTINGNMYLRL
ncbi:hypothetical protein D2V93_15535 [Flagellimonas taeanensis]|jgi:hypothetical protein|uniref:Adhesin n=1 Tax=Flagellimonas taeanensis TaxID=1005926 RepID=A0A1M6Y0T3_9FLAO|nr:MULTISPECIES: hypothetical protein [Allomuricauda]MDC6383802.1 hypothetical protein [Muricauda sp. SK9]RIV48429.1 hypothetical protein D2V93_15535 [Allomuricauda taeanensis]SFC04617.1 hypothetical protein SAMN04487891_10578 [Allomuricauda taeanensis]SHL11862.1 hypothetical protein SAMN05216293_2679 [Allomuricauda taeanensis]